MKQRIAAALVAFALVGGACSRAADPEPTTPSTTATTSSTTTTIGDVVETTTTTTEPVDPALLEELPVDPDVRVGVLDNGLTYYVRSNDSPGGRVEMRLAVNAGSALETDDQSGGAHFLEHMMFNGTEKYPKNDLISVLEAFGPQFGPDINAYTSFDETVYELSVPTDDPAVVEQALDVLVQWAAHATISQTDVAEERGVIVEEWRLRDQGLGGRISAAIVDLVLTGTPYEGREPIGEFDSISTMNPGPLRDFYTDWYRPDLMAVVVVGDIDPDEMEEMVSSAFGGLSGPDDAPDRPNIEVNRPTTPVASVLADPEATISSVDVFYLDPVTFEGPPSVGQLQDLIAQSIALEIMGDRLMEDALRGNAPFFDAMSFETTYTRGFVARGFSVYAEADQLTASAEALLVEIERAVAFGFTEDEVQQAKDTVSSFNQQVFEGQETKQDVQFADEYVGHYLEQAPIFSVDQGYELTNEALERLTAADIHHVFASTVTAAPRLFVLAPDDEPTVPTEEDLVALVDSVAGMTLEPREGLGEIPEQLMGAPDRVAPTALTLNEIFGYLELDYANGARVLFWPTDIAENLVNFQASSFGGLSQVVVEDLVEAEYGLSAISTSGLGEHDQVIVDRILADQFVGLDRYITNTHEGMHGAAAQEDLETLFQLIHLSIAMPRIDDVAVANVLAAERPLVENPEDDPRTLARIALAEMYYGLEDDRHWVVPSVEEFDAFDTDRALEVYQERFGNAGEFLFVFVGDTDVDTIIELSNLYIGSLPGTPSAEGFIDHQPLPRGEQERTVRAGQDNQGFLQIFFTNVLNGQDAETDVVGDLLELIAGNRLRDRIRERLSATYSPFIVIDLQLEPDPYVESYVDVSGDPERLDEIAAEVFDDLADLRTNGPTAEELAIAQEQLFREYELINNGFLIDRLIFFEEHPQRSIIEIADRYDIIATITAADIEALARIAFPVGSYIQIQLVPADS